MTKRGIINLGKILCKILLLALIPILLIIKFKWDAILPTIIYLQFLLIWAQAEIGMRQHLLFSAQFNPSFKVRLGSSMTEAEHKINIYLHNTSDKPAYNIGIVRVFDEKNEPIPPNSWKDKISTLVISSLAPGEEVLLGSADNSFLKNKTIEIFYTNLFGDWKEIWVKFLNEKLLVIPGKEQAPGILLNTFEDLILFLKFIRFQALFKVSKKPNYIDNEKVKNVLGGS